MTLARWVLTVLRLICRSSAISLLVQPLATVIRTCSSRLVSGSMGRAGGGPACVSAKAARSRAVMFGAIRASPRAAAWMACVSWAGPASLSRRPRAGHPICIDVASHTGCRRRCECTPAGRRGCRPTSSMSVEIFGVVRRRRGRRT